MPDRVDPAHLWIPERVGSYGDEAIDLAELAGRTLDAEQRVAVDAMLSYGPGGRWVALEAAVIEARQNGKTSGIMLPVVLFDLFCLARGEDADRIVWTAHLFRTARDTFSDFVALIDGTPELSRRVKKVTFANGEESIELQSGAKLEFLARSKGGGRGLGGKRLVMDEALFLSAESMGALIPTLSAREDPQIVYGSSAGLATSDHLRNLRDRGRKGGDPSLVWVEWCAPGGWDDPPCTRGRDCPHSLEAEGCALDDESLWRLANPALGRRIGPEFVRAERRALPWEEFGRERLGWFDLPLAVDEQPIDVEAWRACEQDVLERPPGLPSFFIDCSPGLSSASVTAAVTHEGRPRLELVDFRPGASWLEGEGGRVLELARRHPGARFGVFGSGAVATLLPGLTELGVEVEQFTRQDMGRACGHLQKLVATGGLSQDGNPLYTSALKGAAKRPLGDDLWTWSRRKSAEISPIVSATGAAWMLATEPAYDVSLSVY
ncbi:hypothetical protein GCM10010182_67500 [Actinomadura cremea]|nr:hypothetical protein GCM10010182_67500 [Actinomadura cremea]